MATRALPLWLLFALLTAACAEPPNKEMDQAQGAIDAARAAGADRYATIEYSAATDALESANEAVGARDYRLALNYALESREQAQNAARVAAEERARLRGELERALAELSALRLEARAQLEGAQGTRAAARGLPPAAEALAVAGESLQEASAALEGDDYQRVATILDHVRTEIADAVVVIESVTSQSSQR